MFKYNPNLTYTAIDADRLEEGDIVAAADNLHALKTNPLISSLVQVNGETSVNRFSVSTRSGSMSYALAQLIAKHDDPNKETKKQAAQASLAEQAFKLLDKVRISDTFEAVVTAVLYDTTNGWRYCCGKAWYDEEELEHVEEEH